MKTRKKNNELGDTIYEARERAGLSTAKLAEMTGTHHSTLADIQTGQTRQPSFETLSRLAKALKLDAARLRLLAGYANAEELPDLKGWLHVKHRELPPDDVNALASHLEFLVAKNRGPGGRGGAR